MTDINPQEDAESHRATAERDLHGADWRWTDAGRRLNRRAGPMLRRLGQDFLDVHHYRTLCAHGPVGQKQARALYPAIATAEELNANAVKTGHLKVAILGELDLAEVCPQLGVDEIVARWWERIFYDVRGTRTAVDWVNIHLIKPELAAGRADLAVRLRMAAAVGAVAARAILKADTRLPICEAEKLFDRQLKFSLKFDAAAEMVADTDKTRLSFMRSYTRLMLEQHRLKLARETLEKKCEEALNRHELAKIRAEIALERERGRAAARARRADEEVLTRTDEEQRRAWLVAFQREREVAEQAATASRIAASPLARLAWRHRTDPGSLVGVVSEAEPAGVGEPAIAAASVPLTILRPKRDTRTLARVSA